PLSATHQPRFALLLFLFLPAALHLLAQSHRPREQTRVPGLTSALRIQSLHLLAILPEPLPDTFEFRSRQKMDRAQTLPPSVRRGSYTRAQLLLHRCISTPTLPQARAVYIRPTHTLERSQEGVRARSAWPHLRRSCSPEPRSYLSATRSRSQIRRHCDNTDPDKPDSVSSGPSCRASS